MKRLNKRDLARTLWEAGLADTLVAGERLVDALTNTVVSEVVAGNEVCIAGFGKFEPYTRTNGTVKPKFIPFKAFKDAMGG